MRTAGYTVIREASVCEVLKHFIRTERTRQHYAYLSKELAAWLDIDGQQFLARMRAFADERDDINPTLTWTVGTRGNKHHERVLRWVLAQLRLAALYSCGINDAMKDDLDAVSGNLAAFVARADKHPEFQLGAVPDGDLRIVIAVAGAQASRDGTIEVVDGAHRAVAMLAIGITETTAFLAELRPEG
jgi:hypothetical protein